MAGPRHSPIAATLSLVVLALSLGLSFASCGPRMTAPSTVIFQANCGLGTYQVGTTEAPDCFGVGGNDGCNCSAPEAFSRNFVWASDKMSGTMFWYSGCDCFGVPTSGAIITVGVCQDVATLGNVSLLAPSNLSPAWSPATSSTVEPATAVALALVLWLGLFL